MSSRRSRSSQSSSSSRITEEQVIDLISKLQALLPQPQTPSTDRVSSAAKVLQETCSYIRKLQNEVHDLSEKVAEFLAQTEETNSAQAALLRTLLM